MLKGAPEARTGTEIKDGIVLCQATGQYIWIPLLLGETVMEQQRRGGHAGVRVWPYERLQWTSQAR